MKNEEIDAVKTMREIRDELSKRYMRDIEIEMRDLEEIQKKYHISDELPVSVKS